MSLASPFEVQGSMFSVGCSGFKVQGSRIGERLSTLTPAEIHVVLAYYHLHHEDIENFLEEERAPCRSLERNLAEAKSRR